MNFCVNIVAKGFREPTTQKVLWAGKLMSGKKSALICVSNGKMSIFIAECLKTDANVWIILNTHSNNVFTDFLNILFGWKGRKYKIDKQFCDTEDSAEHQKSHFSCHAAILVLCDWEKSSSVVQYFHHWRSHTSFIFNNFCIYEFIQTLVLTK
jgi:hypothetical protein